jgi:hypothetical protein
MPKLFYLLLLSVGAAIWAVLVRKKGVTARQPTALVFTIYAEAGSYRQAKQGAAYGYAGMIAYTRGKAQSPDAIEPYEHEAQDAYDVIDWISKRPWSDGQVGMYGGRIDSVRQDSNGEPQAGERQPSARHVEC